MKEKLKSFQNIPIPQILKYVEQKIIQYDLTEVINGHHDYYENLKYIL